MMRDMISVASGFQYSVNIGYDLGSDEKLKNFIPTQAALDLFEDILQSVAPTSSDRARVLIGAYGKGKSHIVLTILSLLMKRELSLFEKLLPKLHERPKLNQLVQNYYDARNRLLPVVISGSNTSLTQAFLLSLQRTLSRYDLLDIMPDTNYKAAIETIKRWEASFPETYQKLQERIDIPIELFIQQLETYNVIAYETFEAVYPALTAGSMFNPFLGFDVVELYESVATSLKAVGYTGLYVVYDEFSKFLEANITEASISDTKMLQDFAEKCCRSGSVQLHLLLISHKEISNYIDKLPKEKTDGWRGVSERFKHIHMNDHFTQTYEIISSVIQHKEPCWKRFCEVHAAEFDGLVKRYLQNPIFTDESEEIETAVKGCFPLHPVSTFILPRLSERIAQNERTLFTFLSAEGSATLSAFLDDYQNDFSLVTPDRIYDYFEPLLQKEIYEGEIHSIFLLTRTILNRLPEGALESKIIKTISLIDILGQYERLDPTKEQIIGIYEGLYDIGMIEQSIDNLIEKDYVVYLKRSNGYLRLKQSSGVDIRQKIHDMMETQAGKLAVKDILNASNLDNYMYPSRYNDEHEMTRFFSFRFISGSEISEIVDWDMKSEAINADGVLYGIIPESEEQLKALSDMLGKVSEGYERYLFVLPRNYQDMETIIREYAAVSELKERNADDTALFDEYEVYFEDLQEVLRSYIGDYTHPENYQAKYYYDGTILAIRRKSGLTEAMSRICDTVYSLTPVINNEAVNKNEITNVAKNSRNRIVSALLRSELEPNLGFSGSGQEVSIMRSTLLRTGIWTDDGGIPQINIHPQDPAMRNLLETIESFILEARSGLVSFGTLYERIVSPKYHIGLRYGVIPIYLAAVIHNYRHQIVIHDRYGPVQMNADVLLLINSEPDNYNLEYLEWDSNKQVYVDNLAAAFSGYVIDAERMANHYDFLANAMRRWYMSLPKYSKECMKHPAGERILQPQMEMIRLLRQNVSSSDLLFKRLPAVFNSQDDYKKTAREIIEAKTVYECLLRELKQSLIVRSKKSFLPKETDISRKKSLTDAIDEWCESLDPKSFEQLFSDGTDRFLRCLKTVTNDEEYFISRLAKLVTGLRIEDWDDKTTELYFQMLARHMETAKAFHSSVVTETLNDTFSYQITFGDEEGGEKTRRFERVEVSARGKLLFNQITAALEAMGQAISEQEKRQILMEVLKKLC